MSRHIDHPNRTGVILLSGGLDSCVALAIARTFEWQLVALSVNYGQRSRLEQAAADKIAGRYGIECVHFEAQMALDTPLIGAQPPPVRTLEEIRKFEPSPWVVPGRNTLLLSFALALAESRGLNAILMGATLEDNAGFSDCRPAFFEAFGKVASLSAGRKIEVIAPLIEMSKRAVVACGKELDAPMELTVSCYTGKHLPCGRCDACMLRADAFHEAGIEDPAL